MFNWCAVLKKGVPRRRGVETEEDVPAKESIATAAFPIKNNSIFTDKLLCLNRSFLPR